MKMYEVVKDLDLDGPSTDEGTAIDLSDSAVKHPFKPGASVVAVGLVVGWQEAEQDGVVLYLEGSENETTDYTTLLTLNSSNMPMVMAEIVLPTYIRTRMASPTAADGRASIYLLGN